MSDLSPAENIISLHQSLNPVVLRPANNTNGYNWIRSVWGGGWNSYTGMVTAGAGATLTGLAELITGDPNDWTEIAQTPRIQANQKISVEPLLRKLELILRVRVVKATKEFYAGFTEATVNASTTDDKTKAINEFFDSVKTPGTDCNVAVGIVMSKGLISGTSNMEYNQLGVDDDIYGVLSTKQRSLATMLIGDSAWLENYDDYKIQPNKGAYQAENVIKVGRDKFWGHIGESYANSVKSAAGWEIHLGNEYNKIAEKKRNDKIPGHGGDARFLNIAFIGMKVFDIRSKNRS